MYDLENLAAGITQIRGVCKEDLRPGDLVVVTTRNSVYTIRVRRDPTWLISGGWFDRRGISLVRAKVIGCSRGGSAIKKDWIAAPGMHLLFGNHVTTSAVSSVCVFRNRVMN